MLRHRRSYLHLSTLSALKAPHTKRHALAASAAADQRPQVERAPAIARRAVAAQFVVVRVQSGDASQVDHAPMLGPRGLAS